MMLLLIIIFIILIIGLGYKSKRSLHMLQQNLYNENNRYIKWTIKNISNFLNREIIGIILFVLAYFVFYDLNIYLVPIELAILVIYISMIRYWQNFFKNEQTKKYNEDFAIEGNINSILINIITLYVSYEIKVAVENSYASENIMRQMVTSESLKKIDELDEEKRRDEIKEKKMKNFKKQLDNINKLNLNT